MSRHIDTSLAIKNIDETRLYRAKDVERLINGIPTADVEEVRHGKWVKKKHLIPLAWDSSPFILENYEEETHSEWKEYWHCSECDYEADRDMKPRFKYCPNCAAKMDLET